ncbi:EpsG family protein [Lapidilactobacillus bayanensis]|uniref:EpsG family protein n=1 Tax=Lapidilactobacillus bayanensis TaxID=2485998 RepID=UPI000F77CC72|nr:EpsG family protein [Lapidilactobacillus bayanensis]
MTFYIVALFVTITISIFFELIKPKSSISQIIASFIISVPMIVVAGLRTVQVGTDILVYGLPNFNAAGSFASFDYYLNSATAAGGTEIGYATLNYLVSRYTSNINILLFIIASLITVPVVYGCFRFANALSISLTVQIVLYFALFYGFSLNLMRQCIAISLIFLGFSYFSINGSSKNNQLVGYSLLILASVFHRSSIVMFPIVIFLFPVEIKNSRFKKIIKFLKMIIIVAIGVVAVRMILSSSSSFVIKYSRYLGIGGSSPQGGQSFFKTLLSIAVPFLILVLFNMKRNDQMDIYINSKEQNESFNLRNISVILLIDIFFQLISISSVVIGRIGFFFKIFEIVLIPFAIKIYFDRSAKWVIDVIICLYYITLFTVFTLSGFNGIYPYISIL